MKKVISIVSVLCVLSMAACRTEDENNNPPVQGNPESSPGHYFQYRGSTESSPSGGGKDQEPPRKDLLQWKGGTTNDGAKELP